MSPIISRDRLTELVAELLAEANDAASLSTEEDQWDIASEIVDNVLAEMQVEETEED